MLKQVFFITALFVVTPVWSQVAAVDDDDTSMQTPPPVSGAAYSVKTGSEARSNYLHAGYAVSTAYNDNVFVGTGANPTGDVSYSIWPTIALDKTTPRLHQTYTYSPGFTFYQHTSSRNQADQNVSGDFQYRLSPHVTLNLQDSFRKSSNVFNQPYPFAGGAVSGSTQAPLVPVLAPVADQISNSAGAVVTYQFSRNGMIGGSGMFTYLHYPKPSQVPGLSDSNSRGLSGFYSHRLASTQYFGVNYQYAQSLGSLPNVQNETQTGANSETQTNTILFFYTKYLQPNLSMSISAGPQHYDVSQYPYPNIRSWAPAAMASLGWQGSRSSFAVSYAHIVGGGGGLLGAFNSNSANASARLQFARTWSVGSTASYAITKNVSPLQELSNPGGHMISGTISAQHPISERFSLEFGYTRLHQSYSNIAVISNAPDSNREYVSISYQLTRPLGR